MADIDQTIVPNAVGTVLRVIRVLATHPVSFTERQWMLLGEMYAEACTTGRCMRAYSVSRTAERFGISKPVICRSLRTFEKAGYITKGKNQNDDRCITIGLTEFGMSEIRATFARIEQAVAQ